MTAHHCSQRWENEYVYAALNKFRSSKEPKSQQGCRAKVVKNVTSFQ